MHPQKKDASSQELSNSVFSNSSNVNSHIMTDAIFVMYSVSHDVRINIGRLHL